MVLQLVHAADNSSRETALPVLSWYGAEVNRRG